MHDGPPPRSPLRFSAARAAIRGAPAWAVAALAIVGCSRAPASGADDAGPGSAGAAGPGRGAADVAGGRVQYLILGVLNPLLRPHLRVLGDHFGGEGDEPFAVQSFDAGAERTLLLVSRMDEQDPILLVVDHGRLAWSASLPQASAPEAYAHVALAPRPDRGVAVFGYVAASHALSARMWGADGASLGDVRVASMPACDGLSVAYAPGLGWIAVCSGASSGRAQWLRDDGRAAWGEQGAEVGEAGAVGPMTVVAAARGAWVLVQAAQRADAQHVLAFRYDMEPRPLWATPADLGVPRRASRGQRFVASVGRDGWVRVEVPQGLSASRAQAVEVGPDGATRAAAAAATARQ